MYVLQCKEHRNREQYSLHYAQQAAGKELSVEKKPVKHEGLRQAIHAFSFLSGIGIYFVVVLGICIYLGNLADEEFGLGFYGKLTGSLLGFPVAIYCVYRSIRKDI